MVAYEGEAAVDQYKRAASNRKQHVDVVLASDAHRKVVVAGPGTGKTHLFKEILKGKRKALTLTFINTLVEDLARDLYGMSEVATLHSFARSQLSSALGAEVKIFPKLSTIIKQDALILRGDPAVRRTPIKAKTIQSSKGLAEHYVFITHFDDRFFIKDKDKTKISDQDICNFLVSLTRARRKVFLISTEKKDPTFLTWIDKSRIQRI